MDFYRGKDPKDAPAYTVQMAAGMLDMSPSTLRTWVRGYTTSYGKTLPKVIVPAKVEPLRLSFTNLVEAFVLAVLRKERGIDLPKVRKTLDYLAKELGKAHPLATEKFATDGGARLFVKMYDRLVSVTDAGQLQMEMVLATERIQYVDGNAGRLFPVVRKGAALREAPRYIVIDPTLAFGRPVVAGTGVPVEVLQDRWAAGDDIATLSHEYNIDALRIEEALRAARATAGAAAA